ncbi:hypothetical protein KAU09_02310 [Candidatus Parcubacteria bacterium]|nr:hypothetical protein [Candidatus Parcubacteria bacterium]
MYNIIPLVLILISLGVIIVIVVRKFSVLANLDVDSIQSEREAKFKERIISNRLKRNYFKYYAKVTRALKPVGQATRGFFHSLFKKLLEYKEDYQEQKQAEALDENIQEKLFSEIDELIEKDELDKIEAKYIKIISLDSKNIKAFRGLGRLYFERKDFNEAKQTMEHAIRLLERDYNVYEPLRNEDLNEEERVKKDDISRNLSGSYFDLALVYKQQEKYAEAIISTDKALAIEANNPRFLDAKLEISIMNKDKDLAWETFEKLKAANPENQKLEELAKQIDEL